MGGCRIAPYVDFNAALTDVLRLFKGMSNKNIMAGLPYGGGKAVILADPRTGKTAEMQLELTVIGPTSSTPIR